MVIQILKSEIRMIQISRNIYNGTLLEGIPYRFRYTYNRPDEIYRVRDHAITLHNYEGWHDLYNGVTLFKLQKLFLHDISHAVLYHLRNENKKLFKSEFGLTWKHVKSLKENEGVFHFSNHKELMDEYSIMAIHDILNNSIKKKASPDLNEEASHVYLSANYVWHTADIYTKKNEFRKDVLKKKWSDVEEAVDFVYSSGLDTIRDSARSLVAYLKTNM